MKLGNLRALVAGRSGYSPIFGSASPPLCQLRYRSFYNASGVSADGSPYKTPPNKTRLIYYQSIDILFSKAPILCWLPARNKRHNTINVIVRQVRVHRQAKNPLSYICGNWQVFWAGRSKSTIHRQLRY